MDQQSLTISDDDLRSATKEAVRYLMYEENMSQTDIGRAIGYDDGQMIGRLLRDESMLSPVRLVNLARLASSRGDDSLADIFSAPSKVSVPALEGQAGDMWAPDRDVTREVAGVTMGTGTFPRHVLSGRLQQARQCLREGLVELRRCWHELDEIEERGLPGRFDGRGDGLPSQPSLAL